MLTQKQRSDMRDGIPAMGESTARVWVRELLDHADEMETLARIIATLPRYDEEVTHG